MALIFILQKTSHLTRKCRQILNVGKKGVEVRQAIVLDALLQIPTKYLVVVILQLLINILRKQHEYHPAKTVFRTKRPINGLPDWLIT